MDRITTGTPSLDRILGGGLPSGSLIVVAGPPGSGKTILAQQICFANAEPDRKAIYYTTWSESHEKLVQHLEPFAFFDHGALGEKVEFLHLADLLSDDRSGFDAIAEELQRTALRSRPAVVVIDSSKALHDVIDPDRFRRGLYDLASVVAYSDAVLMLVGEYTPRETREAPEFAIADGIIQIENESQGPVDRRWVRILKMRGAEIAPGQHSVRIGAGGFEVFPRLETTLPKDVPAPTGRALFGIPGADEMVGGGIPRGDATLVAGPSGVGKTLLALHFVATGLENGERCLYISLQETEEQLLEKAAAAGWAWRGQEDRLVLHHVAPVELDLNAVGALIRDELTRGPVQRVVVDSLAELSFAARDTARFPAYVWALGGFVRAVGGTTLFTTEIASLGHGADLGGLSFLFNNVLFLRYVETGSELLRGINVLKMRQSAHAHGIAAFEIGDHGIEVTGPIEGVSGMLGWSALRAEDADGLI